MFTKHSVNSDSLRHMLSFFEDKKGKYILTTILQVF